MWHILSTLLLLLGLVASFPPPTPLRGWSHPLVPSAAQLASLYPFLPHPRFLKHEAEHTRGLKWREKRKGLNEGTHLGWRKSPCLYAVLTSPYQTGIKDNGNIKPHTLLSHTFPFLSSNMLLCNPFEAELSYGAIWKRPLRLKRDCKMA